MAAADQLTAEFKDLTEDLLGLYNHVCEIAERAEHSEMELEQIAIFQGEITRRLLNLISEEGDPVKLFGFIVYLINVVSNAQDLQIALGRHLNLLGSSVNDMAARIGMVPIVGGGESIQHGLIEERVYVTGAGQKLYNVHLAENCRGWCVIHNPIPGPWSEWKTVWRGDGPFDVWRGFERICPCGVGHTAVEHILEGDLKPHGCGCGCPCGPGRAKALFDDEGLLAGYEELE